MSKYLLILSVLWSGLVQAKCEKYPLDLKESFGSAEEVILVEVREIECRPHMPFERYKASYHVIERFKGENSKSGYATYWDEAHSLRMEKGRKYILFIAREHRAVGICTGSMYYQGEEEILEKLRGMRGGT